MHNNHSQLDTDGAADRPLVEFPDGLGALLCFGRRAGRGPLTRRAVAARVSKT